MNAPGSHTTMLPATLKALKGSIAKWEAIVAGTDIDRGCENCPLCLRFNRDFLDKPFKEDADQCKGCPVAQAVGQPGCEGTPYMEGRFVHVERDGKKSYQPTKETAQAELDFLKSLLPAEAQTDEERT